LHQPGAAGELRRQAEERLEALSAAAAAAAAAAAPVPQDAADIVQELRVHQIELEMQNEELRRAQLELDAQRAKYFELFDLAPVGYLTISDAGIVRDANLTAARLLGVERQELVEKPFTAFIPAADQDVYYRHRKLLEQTGWPQTCELRLRSVGAAPFWAHLEWQPQRAANGEPLRYHLTFTDVHERVLAEEALRLSEDKFAKAFHGTPDAILISRLSDGRVVEVNEGFLRLSGFTREEALGSSTLALDLWAAPADRELCIAALRRDGSVSGLDFAFRSKAGEILECLYAGAIMEVEGEAHILSLVHDVTAQRRAAAAVKESEALLRGILDNMQDAYVRTDGDGRFVMVSPSAVRMYGYDSVEEMIGLPASSLYADQADREAMFAELRRLGSVTDYVGWGRRKDGSAFWVSLNAHFYRDDAGNVLGSEGFVRDITARKQAEEQIQRRNQELAHLNDELVSETAALAEANATITRVAATDYLTGLANRRCFYESLEKAVSLARRHGYPVALVSFDLDGLKRVNDSAGHEAGDEVLVSFADLLAALCRAEDLPGRLGGDEFSLLLPGDDLVGGRGLAERVLAAVRSCEALAQRGVTVSGGAAQWMPDELPDDLLRRADEALYAAKRCGGGAVAGDGADGGA